MKKVITILAMAFCLSTNAQYTKLIDFANDTMHGTNPTGSLIQASDGMLYGMTNAGGAHNMGVIFQYNPITNTYTKKLDFAGTTNGSTPHGSLMQASDSMLYGMTSQGGANAEGVLFQYNPATSAYTIKFNFVTATGGSPFGSLMQASDSMLYGMTFGGGAHNDGVLFQYNPTTNTYIDKHDFGSNNDGIYPYGSLIQASDGNLYGMTNGGNLGISVLFQYKPATSTYNVQFDFTGSKPYGSLMQASDGNLYGMNSAGGSSTNTTCSHGCGALFQSPPGSGVYNVELNFGGTPGPINGKNPYGSLIQASDGNLYGMTQLGGAIGEGVLFQYNLTTTNYTDMVDFPIGNDITNGYNPYGDLMQASDGCLYGMTQYGGASTTCASGCGVLFKYCIGATTGVKQVRANINQASIYPNPSNGSFTIETNPTTNQTIKLYDVNGQMVLNQIINGKTTTIDATFLNEGVYNISIISNDSVINKRVVIVH